jgi:tetratricopeptide (TPR) repeat protein
MKRWVLLLSAVALLMGSVGCATPPSLPAPDETVFHDELFGPAVPAPDTRSLFSLTPAMRTYLAEHIQPQVRRKGAQMALLDALYTQGELRLEYDALRTRDAAEAFDARMGNCLSLVIMTAAFATEMGLEVRYNDVLGQPDLEQSGDLTFIIGHVNLALGGGLADRQPGVSERSWVLVDFLPGQDLRSQRTRPLDERRIRAMYMNNRAAEALARGQVREAYWWVRHGWAQDSRFANLYNTLGVIYRHRGAFQASLQALAVARRLEPDNEHVTRNLAGVRAAQLAAGGPATTSPLGVQANGLQRARAALAQGRSTQALSMLQLELDMAPHSHEIHYWMAVALARIGDGETARRHLELAARYSEDGELQALYAGKLARLKLHRSPLPPSAAPSFLQ